ncbi:FMN-binding glutamate synthase family protein [Hyphococcus sp.]|uniref:FMN-binding glutamate synthase family protein n=1 Tax=Hyphococcus sp. TaxID=2038636 RepID=UPI002088F113|nr:MAG: FMN-binding glutamate synthase family protein [Marinicaulis sp.]
MDFLARFTMTGIEVLTTVFIFAVGVGVLLVFFMFVADSSQSRDAIRHNYPVVGRFRDLFTRLGEFFRQYFFALDREEMPFNRAERDWIYKSAKGSNNTLPFGSTRNLNLVGCPIFINCAFPRLDEEASDPPPVEFGPYTPNPYRAASIINVSAMSFGSLSKPAVQSLSRGAKLAGCYMNTGEGGLAPYHLEGGCDIIFQMGTAKYGCRNDAGMLDEAKLAKIAANSEVKMIEVKLSQGAKPGKGGILPGAKVTKEIAQIRHIPPGKPSISPNRHLEIDNVEELLDFIDRVRRVSTLPTGFKTVLGAYGWVDELCDAIERRGIESAPDFITLDGGDGGTGAAPMSLMDNVGLPLKQALPMLTDILERRGLRDRIKVIAAGKLVTPAEVAWAYCAGADVVNTARGFMFSIGCIQAMKCHTNNCPTGVTTHKKSLQGGLDPKVKSKQVASYVEKMRKDVAMIAHSCGAPHARALKPIHVRIQQADGTSVPLNELLAKRRPMAPHEYKSAAH